MHAYKKQLIAFAALLITIFAGYRYWHSEIKEPSPVEILSADSLRLTDEAIKNIKITQISAGDFDDRLTLMGRVSVTEDRTNVVASRVSGRIESVFVASGERVTKGQPLVSLYSPDFVIAKEEYLQAIRLAKQGTSAFGEDDMVKLAKRKLEAMGLGQTDINALETAGSQNSAHFTLRAVRGGVILDKKAMIGNPINVGDVLFTIADLDKVWFTGDVYPEDVNKVNKSQDLVIDSVIEGGKPILGKVSFISPNVDPQTRTIKIRALMDNSDHALLADMYIKGHVTLSKRTALLLPKSAVLRDKDTLYCFKNLPGNVFQRIPVEFNGEQQGMVSVTKGLTSGDKVVTDGALLLQAALTEIPQ